MPAITFTKKWIFLFMIFNYYYGAAQSDFPYQKPDTDILSLADARPAPSIRIKADASLAVLLFRNAYKSIEEMAAPEMKLAGIRINPMTNSPSRITYFNDIKILDILSGTEYSIDGMPVSPALSNFVWSNDQSLMAFTNTVKEGMELWILDMNQKKVKKLTEPILNANVGNVFIWSKDNKSLLLTTLVKDRKPLLDGKFAIPTGPVITENDGQKAQNRTYQDLLKNPVDEQNFELLTTSEISRVNLDGKLSLFKGPAMYVGMSFSPDGSYLLTYELKKPFSYIVTYDRFPTDINLLDKDGKFIKTFISIPLTEELPKGFMAVRKGPRSLQLRAE